jgi:hypothetical protein
VISHSSLISSIKFDLPNITNPNLYFLEPETPPSAITCRLTGSSVMVTWQRPTKSNGQIIKYRIMWFGSRKKPKMKMLNGETYSYTMSNVKRDSKFVVRLIAENSAGQSPLGRCIVDTTKIPTGRLSTVCYHWLTSHALKITWPLGISNTKN